MTGPAASPAQGTIAWDRVAGLAEQLLACGREPEAFRTVLLYRIGWGGDAAAEFLRTRFRAVPLKLAVVMDEGIGNMVMLTPALRALKEMLPCCQLEVVGRAPALEVLAGCNGVACRTRLAEFAAGAERDALLLSPWSANFVRAFGPWLKGWRGPIIQARLEGEGRHESELHLDLVRVLGYSGPTPAPYCATKEVRWPFESGRPIVLLADTTNPSPSWARKRWPHYPELGAALLDGGYQVGLVGGPAEAQRFDPARWPAGVVNLLGRYSIPETAWLISRADALVANDSGPAHLGGAVGARTYVLFGATREAKNHPLGSRVHVITADLACRPCQYLPRWSECRHFRCMEGIGVARVVREVCGEGGAARDASPAAPGLCGEREGRTGPWRVQQQLWMGLYPYTPEEAQERLSRLTGNHRVRSVKCEALGNSGDVWEVDMAIDGPDQGLVLEFLIYDGTSGRLHYPGRLNVPCEMEGTLVELTRRCIVTPHFNLGGRVRGRIEDLDFLRDVRSRSHEYVWERLYPGTVFAPLRNLVTHMTRYALAADIAEQNGATRIADAACGVGYGTKYLSRRCPRVDGIDLSLDSLETARRYFDGPRVEWLHADLAQMPYEDGSLDCLVCFELLEHLAEPQPVLKEIRRVLKDRGRLILSTPNGESDARKAIENPYHQKEYTSAELASLLSSFFGWHCITAISPAGKLVELGTAQTEKVSSFFAVASP